MKKLFLALTLGLALGSLCPQPAQAQKLSVSAARAQIQTCYNRYGQAMKTKNLNMINSLLASDYTGYTMQGRKSDRNASLNADRMVFRLPSAIQRYVTRIKSIEARGADMIVMAETTLESTAGSGARTINSKGVINTRDYWSPIKNSNGWVLRQRVETSGDMWMNGKKIS